jgi:transposase InsO family protein
MKSQHAITTLCQALEVSPSGYYDWEKRKTAPAPRSREEALVRARIARIYQDSRQTYGAPRVHSQLRREGCRHGRNRIARLMRQDGLCGRQKKRYRVRTTDSRHDEPIGPNRLAQVLAASGADQIWVADITYVRTAAGWVYVAAILDL